MSIFGGNDGPPDPATSATDPVTGKRRRRPGSPVDPVTGVPVDAEGKPLDKAVPRGTGGMTPTPPPGANETLSTSTSGAQSAAERQRKRAAAGLTLLHGGLRQGPKANLRVASLIGGH